MGKKDRPAIILTLLKVVLICKKVRLMNWEARDLREKRDKGPLERQFADLGS